MEDESNPMGPIPPPPDARCPGGANPVDVQTIFTGSVEDFKICMQLEQRERTRSNDGIVTFMPDFRWLLPRSASYVASMMGECNLQMILFRHRRSPPSVSFCATVDAAANAPPTTTHHSATQHETRLTQVQSSDALLQHFDPCRPWHSPCIPFATQHHR